MSAAADWSLHPQVQALVDAQETEPEDAGPPSLESLRDGYLQLALERGGAVEPVDAAEDIVFPRGDGSVRGRLYTPLQGARVPGTLVWLHGGGWCLGDLEGFDRVCRSLANASGAMCLSVDYRLAPEHPFPAAVHDADAAVEWAAQRGPVVLGGDSAGGNLAAVAARHARDAGLSLAGQLLVYPATDAAMKGASYAGANPPMLTKGEMGACWAAYRGGAPVSDPDVSPLRCQDLGGLPPAFVAVAGADVLRSDGEAYAEALRAAGVDVTFAGYDDMTHGFLRWGGLVDRARELVEQLAGQTAAWLAAAADAPRLARG